MSDIRFDKITEDLNKKYHLTEDEADAINQYFEAFKDAMEITRNEIANKLLRGED